MGYSRWFTLILLSVLAAGTFAVGSASAAEAPAGKGGGPDLFKQALDLGIWTLVVFLLLVFILRRYAWNPMLEGLRRREENIQHALVEARKAREQAESVRVQLEREMAKVNDQIRAMMEEAHRDAESTKAQRMAEAEAEIRAERDRTLREIQTARDQALQDLWNQTAQLAAHVSTKAIRRQLTADDHRRLVDEALTELRQAAMSDGRR